MTVQRIRLLLLALCVLLSAGSTTVRAQSSWSYAVRADDGESGLALYDSSDSSSPDALDSLSPLWTGEITVDEDGVAHADPSLPASLAIADGWRWPGAAASYDELPAIQAQIASGATLVDNGTDPRNSDQLRRVSSSPALWLQFPLSTRPHSAFLSPDWTCDTGSAGPAFAFADRQFACWSAGGSRVGSTKLLLFGSSVTKESSVERNIFPLTLTAAYTSVITTTGVDTAMRGQAVLMLLHSALTHRDAAASVHDTESSNTHRRNKARVAVGFLWAFAALVMLSLCFLSATFQSWLLPVFPQRFAFLAWLLLLCGLTIGVSWGTGISGFLMLALIYLAYCISVGLLYYIKGILSRETPSNAGDVAENKALLESAPEAAATKPEGNSCSSSRDRDQAGERRAPQEAKSPRSGGGLLSPRALVVRPRAQPVELTVPTKSLHDESTRGGGNASSKASSDQGLASVREIEMAPPGGINALAVVPSASGNAFDQRGPLRSLSADMDGLGPVVPCGLNPYERYPSRLGWLQHRLLAFSSLSALGFLVLCVALFGVWRVDSYRVLEGTRSLPLRPGVVEYIPQTIAKGVASVYMFDGLATKLHLDSSFFHLSTEWCGRHYSGYLTTEEQRYSAIEEDYVIRYGIDMSEFVPDSYANYSSVNEWFARHINLQFRPLAAAPDALSSPADARVTVWRNNPEGVKLWIKGEKFTMREFLGDDANPEQFNGVTLALFRLAPQDFHRFMMPLAGTLVSVVYLEGGLQSVDRDGITSKNYAIYNQRTVMLFDSPNGGRFAFVAIGALCVGSVVLEPPPGSPPFYGVTPGMQYARGDPLGYFEFGSTIALVFQPGRVRFDDALVIASDSQVETLVQCRQRMGLMITNTTNTLLTPS